MGGRIADSQSKAAQQHCFPLEVFLAGPYRSTLPDRMFTCATCHYIAHILSCVSITKLQNRGWNVSPPYAGPTKALSICASVEQCDSEKMIDPGLNHLRMWGNQSSRDRQTQQRFVVWLSVKSQSLQGSELDFCLSVFMYGHCDSCCKKKLWEM